MSEFSLQGCTRAETRLSESPGDKFLRESVDHLPLFGIGNRVPRDAHARSAGRPGRGPLVYGPYFQHSRKLKPVCGQTKTFPNLGEDLGKRIRCDFPGIESSNPRLKHSPSRKRVPRGQIETLSESSRRNLKLILHTITFEALAYHDGADSSGMHRWHSRSLCQAVVSSCFATE